MCLFGGTRNTRTHVGADAAAPRSSHEGCRNGPFPDISLSVNACCGCTARRKTAAEDLEFRARGYKPQVEWFTGGLTLAEIDPSPK